jgi:phage protein D
MLHPNYKVQVGSFALDPNTSDDVMDIRLDLSMDVPTDFFEGLLRIRKQGLEYAKGDRVAVSLGYDSNLTNVFNGTLDMLNIDFSKVYVRALSSMMKLCNLRIDRFYEQQKAGAIVNDLASTASVSVDTVSDGIELPYYAVDSNKNAYEHIMMLAESCGFDVYCTNEDKLMFKKYEAKEPHELEYGKNVIRIVKVEQKDFIKSVRVFGESPASRVGKEKAHWLTKEQVKGLAGSGHELQLQSRIVRYEDTAKEVAEAKLNRLKLSMILMIEVVGDPTLILGETARIVEMPDEHLNGMYQIRGVEHFLTKSSGFTTFVKCRGITDE